MPATDTGWGRELQHLEQLEITESSGEHIELGLVEIDRGIVLSKRHRNRSLELRISIMAIRAAANGLRRCNRPSAIFLGRRCAEQADQGLEVVGVQAIVLDQCQQQALSEVTAITTEQQTQSRPSHWQ